MPITASVSLPSNSKKKVIWFWQSNPTSADANCQKQMWKHYCNFENKYIEECYLKRNEEVELNDIMIDFEMNMQVHKDGITKQTLIKREEINVTQYFREERFCYPARRVKSFVDQNKYDISASVFCTW